MRTLYLNQLMFRYLLSFIILLLFSVSSYSQKKLDPTFPTDDPFYKNWGWHAGIGGNYTVTNNGKHASVYVHNPDTVSYYNFIPRGQVGAMVEGGAFLLLDNIIVSYLDAGLRVNWFQGKNIFTENRVTSSTNDTILFTEGERSFDIIDVSLRMNANNTIQLSNYGFIQNTLGLNVDYQFIKNQQTFPPIFPLDDFANDKFQFQLHYKLAYGFRLDLMRYMIVGIDVPLMTFHPWNGGSQTIDVFGAQYWPITLSVNVMFLQKSNRPDCRDSPKVNMNKRRRKERMF